MILVKYVIGKMNLRLEIGRDKSWQGHTEKGTLYTFSGNVSRYNHYRETVQRFLRKLKIEPPFDPATLLLGICPEEGKQVLIIHNSQDIETSMCTVDLDKEGTRLYIRTCAHYIYTHMQWRSIPTVKEGNLAIYHSVM